MSQILLASNYKGYYTAQSILEAAIPVGAKNWWAIVGNENAVYIWNIVNQEWATSSGSGSGAVDSVFGRTGNVVAVSGDYDASEITNTPQGNITADNVQDAINQLATLAPIPQREEAAGIKDGSNKIFTLSEIPIENSLSLYLNGQLLAEGVGEGYTISGSTITLTTAPSSGESVFAIYLKSN